MTLTAHFILCLLLYTSALPGVQANVLHNAARLKGRVLFDYGCEVSAAKVTVSNAQLALSSSTDRHGEWNVIVPPGEYEVTITGEGFETLIVRKVTVTKEDQNLVSRVKSFLRIEGTCLPLLIEVEQLSPWMKSLNVGGKDNSAAPKKARRQVRHKKK